MQNCTLVAAVVNYQRKTDKSWQLNDYAHNLLHVLPSSRTFSYKQQKQDKSQDTSLCEPPLSFSETDRS